MANGEECSKPLKQHCSTTTGTQLQATAQEESLAALFASELEVARQKLGTNFTSKTATNRLPSQPSVTLPEEPSFNQTSTSVPAHSVPSSSSSASPSIIPKDGSDLQKSREDVTHQTSTSVPAHSVPSSSSSASPSIIPKDGSDLQKSREDVTHQTSTSVPAHTIPSSSSASPTHTDAPDLRESSKDTKKDNAAADVRPSYGHRAGFDAFMTGYVFAHFAHFAATQTNHKQILPMVCESLEFNEAMIAGLSPMRNKLSNRNRPVPLILAKSQFDNTSPGHRENCAKIAQL